MENDEKESYYRLPQKRTNEKYEKVPSILNTFDDAMLLTNNVG